MFMQQVANSLALGGVYSLMTLGYSLIFGVLQLLHFSYGAVMVLGGYIALTVLAGTTHVFATVLAATIILTVLVGSVVERLSFRPMRKAPIIVTLITGIGMSLMIENAIMLIWGPARKVFTVDIPVPTLSVSGIQLSGSRFLSIIVCVVAMVGIDLLLKRTRLGIAIRATIQDPDAAVLMGVNREFIIVSTFAAGTALSGVAIVLLGSMYGVIYPTEGSVIGTKAFAAAIIGGLGSIPGAVIGAMLLGFVETLGAAYISVGYKDAIAMILLVVILLIRPAGLLGKSTEENI